MTTAVTTDENRAKKVRTDPDQSGEQDRVPSYLLPDHPQFKRILRQNSETSSALSLDELQRLAFCIHQISILPMQEELWSAYLQCGTGGWREAAAREEVSRIEHRRRFWPQHVKSLMSSRQSTFPSEMTDEDEQNAYEHVVHQRLREIRHQLARYRTQYEEKQGKLTVVLVEALQALVREQVLVPLRLKVDLALAVLRCDADDQWLQGQYQAQQPTSYQVRMNVVTQHCPTVILLRCKWLILCTRLTFNCSVLNANSRSAENVCFAINQRPRTTACTSRFQHRCILSRIQRSSKPCCIGTSN